MKKSPYTMGIQDHRLLCIIYPLYIHNIPQLKDSVSYIHAGYNPLPTPYQSKSSDHPTRLNELPLKESDAFNNN